MTFIDFFAGIGGFRLGMEMASHKCLGFCEYDKFAVASYRAMHDTEGEWYSNDIRELRANDIPRADCWTFGFPCQDISVAGKQLGFDGKRSSLFFTVTRLIRDTKEEDRPITLFIENVKNLLSVNGGVDFLKLLIELDEIGYDAEWQVLNSKNFGVPQNRERVFIIGHFRGRSRREVFPIREDDKMVIGEVDRLQDTRQIACSLRAADYKGTHNMIREVAKINPNRHSSLMNSVLNPIEIVPALDCMQGGNRQPKVLVVGNVNPSGNGMNGQVFDSKGLAPTLTTNKGEGNKIAILTPKRTEYGKEIRKAYESHEVEESRHNMTKLEPREDGISNTLTSVQKDNLLTVNSRIRKLTPKECFRLQGFPDTYFDRAAKVNSNSQLYKQAGNSVTANVIYEIAKRLERR